VFLPTFQVFTAVGIAAAVSFINTYISVSKRFLRYVVFAGVALFALFNFAYYLDMYFVQQNPEYSEYWQYGYKEAVALTETLKAKYQKVVVSTTLDESYMFFLFYTKYDPAKYLASGGTQTDRHFDKYEFRKIDWAHEKFDGTTLYVGDPKDIPHANIKNITFLDGTPAIEISDSPNSTP
jgi:hypothetical protein